MNQPITINLNRGLKGMAEGLIRRLPHGDKILDNGLRAVIHRSIDENPDIPKQDFTALDLAERAGLVQRPRRRRA